MTGRIVVDPTALGAGLRVTGAVFALGYLLGFLDGPVVVLAAGVGLMVLGRILVGGSVDALVSMIALSVFAGALGVAALRWNTLEIGTLRGAQAVLGPTLLVGPASLATAAWLAAVGAALALAVWSSLPAPPSTKHLGVSLVEAVVAALAIGTVSWGPSLSEGLDGTGVIGWVLVTLAALVPTAALLELVRRRPALATGRPRWVLVTVAGLLVIAAAVVASLGP